MTGTKTWSAFSSARWFSGKGRGGHCQAVTPLGWYGPGPVLDADGVLGVDSPAVVVRSEVATIDYPDGGREHYQLLVSYRIDPLTDAALPGVIDPILGQAHDAMRDPDALAQVIEAICDHRVAADGSWSTTMALPLPGGAEPRVYAGEQSNTNLMLGDVAIAKFFRKLEAGHNLDIAVHQALNDHGVDSVARLHGWVTGRVAAAGTQDGHISQALTTDLVMVVEQLRDAQDGWQLAVDACAAGADFTTDARQLGAALAEVHAALADAFGTTELDPARIIETMDDRLSTASRAAAALAAYADSLRALFAHLGERPLTGQRIHGDFHLGQTLRTPGGWRIIDFEGEPMKTLVERTVPDSPLRDVAGMLRSFSYATSGTDDPSSPGAQRWLADVTAAFLEGYGLSGLSDAPGGDRAVLAAYEADKAVYEVVYETRNRPDWVHIPMSAIQQLTEGVHHGA